jgi:hypothetical protein
MQTATVQIDSLVPDPENPRTHDERNLQAIKASLQEHGQVEPLLVQKSTNMVIAGNGRMQAMKLLGWSECHVVIVDVDDIQARKLSIQLNRSGELAGWDEATLTKHLQDLGELAAFDVEAMGFDSSELEQLVAAYGEETIALGMEPPPPSNVPKPPNAQGGEKPALGDGTTAPAPMPTSGVRMVQLFLNDETIDPFHLAVRKLAKQWNTDNVTDTVQQAVLRAAENLEE